MNLMNTSTDRPNAPGQSILTTTSIIVQQLLVWIPFPWQPPVSRTEVLRRTRQLSHPGAE